MPTPRKKLHAAIDDLDKQLRALLPHADDETISIISRKVKKLTKIVIDNQHLTENKEESND